MTSPRVNINGIPDYARVRGVVLAHNVKHPVDAPASPDGYVCCIYRNTAVRLHTTGSEVLVSGLNITRRLPSDWRDHQDEGTIWATEEG